MSDHSAAKFLRVAAIITNIAFLEPNLAAPSPTAIQPPASFPGNGAVCDGAVDDTEAVNLTLASMKGGGTAYIAAQSFCLINSSNLNVPPNVRVQGIAGPNATNPKYTNGSGFSLNPAFTIKLSHGSSLENIIVKRTALISEPSPEQVIEAVAKWGNEPSVGVTIPSNIAGVSIEHVFVIGFNTCIKSFSGAFSISHLWGDCYNGIEVAHAGDIHHIDDVRFEPIYGVNVSPISGAWARPGIAFYLHDSNTGAVLTRVFSFMFANGVLMNNVGVTQIANSGWEWQSSMGKKTIGTVGVRWINHNAQTSVSNSYVNGFDTPFSDEGTGDVSVITPSIVGASVAGFYLGGVTASAKSFQISTLAGGGGSLRISSDHISNSPVLIKYSVSSNDTTSSVAANLANTLNRNQALIAARFFASAANQEVTIFWPLSTSATVSAQTSEHTISKIVDKPAQPGSYGVVYGPNINIWKKGVPAFAIGAHANHWLIDAPYTTAYKGWISIPDESDASVLSLRGITYAKSGIAGLSNCGLNPSIDASGTDEATTISEGSAATGCTYEFTVPFFRDPFCTVSSPTGSAISSYKVTAKTLVIANPLASNAKFTFRCNP